MPKFAQRMTTMEKSARVVEKLFKSMTSPETISFGGGAPAKELFPTKILQEISYELFGAPQQGQRTLQYGSPEGERELREVVAQFLLEPKGVCAVPEDIMIVNGGLETMNLICQVFIDPGDVILVESPTFVHCVEIFEMFQAKCVAVESDEQGLCMDDVEQMDGSNFPVSMALIACRETPTFSPTSFCVSPLTSRSSFNLFFKSDSPLYVMLT